MSDVNNSDYIDFEGPIQIEIRGASSTIFSKKQYNNVNKYFDLSSLILNLAFPFFLPYQLTGIILKLFFCNVNSRCTKKLDVARNKFKSRTF